MPLARCIKERGCKRRRPTIPKSHINLAFKNGRITYDDVVEWLDPPVRPTNRTTAIELINSSMDSTDDNYMSERNYNKLMKSMEFTENYPSVSATESDTRSKLDEMERWSGPGINVSPGYADIYINKYINAIHDQTVLAYLQRAALHSELVQITGYPAMFVVDGLHLSVTVFERRSAVNYRAVVLAGGGDRISTIARFSLGGGARMDFSHRNQHFSVNFNHHQVSMKRIQEDAVCAAVSPLIGGDCARTVAEYWTVPIDQTTPSSMLSHIYNMTT